MSLCFTACIFILSVLKSDVVLLKLLNKTGMNTKQITQALKRLNSINNAITHFERKAVVCNENYRLYYNLNFKQDYLKEQRNLEICVMAATRLHKLFRKELQNFNNKCNEK